MIAKIGECLAVRIESIAGISKRTKQQERLLTEYMLVARIALLAE